MLERIALFSLENKVFISSLFFWHKWTYSLHFKLCSQHGFNWGLWLIVFFFFFANPFGSSMVDNNLTPTISMSNSYYIHVISFCKTRWTAWAHSWTTAKTKKNHCLYCAHLCQLLYCAFTEISSHVAKPPKVLTKDSLKLCKLGSISSYYGIGCSL